MGRRERYSVDFGTFRRECFVTLDFQDLEPPEKLVSCTVRELNGVESREGGGIKPYGQGDGKELFPSKFSSRFAPFQFIQLEKVLHVAATERTACNGAGSRVRLYRTGGSKGSRRNKPGRFMLSEVVHRPVSEMCIGFESIEKVIERAQSNYCSCTSRPTVELMGGACKAKALDRLRASVNLWI